MGFFAVSSCCVGVGVLVVGVHWGAWLGGVGGVVLDVRSLQFVCRCDAVVLLLVGMIGFVLLGLVGVLVSVLGVVFGFGFVGCWFATLFWILSVIWLGWS